MKNIFNIIKQRNATVLSTSTTPKRLCNCRNKNTCTLDGSCLKQCFIYNTEIHVKNDYKSTIVQLKVNLNSDIITTQNPLEIGIMNMILSLQNMYGN